MNDINYIYIAAINDCITLEQDCVTLINALTMLRYYWPGRSKLWEFSSLSLPRGT